MRPNAAPVVAVAAALCAAATSTVAAQTPAPPPNCDGAAYRQLDFWVGDWTVFNTADGAEYATSRIERFPGNCGVRETYESPKAPGGPYVGTSYSSVDFRDGRWHQMYVDNRGGFTWYTGGMEGADMVLIAAARGGAIQKMVYSPQADGSVKQIGTVSTDGGKSWAAGYDYTYRRR